MMQKRGFKFFAAFLLLLICVWSINDFCTGAAAEEPANLEDTGNGGSDDAEAPVCLDQGEGDSSSPSCKTSSSDSGSSNTANKKNKWNEENLEAVFELWNFNTTEQQESLRQLGYAIKDVNHWKNDPYEVIRFLKQFDMDSIRAEKLFRDMVQWRIDNDIDTLLKRKPEQQPIFNMVPVFIMEHLDKDGDPIFIDRSGSCDAFGLLQQVPVEQVLESFHFVMECMSTRGGPDSNNDMPAQLDWQRNLYEAQNGGRRIVQFTFIVDLQNLSWRQIRPVVFAGLQKSSRSAQYNYPGYAKRVVFIRAPKIFRRMWSFIQHFYDEQSQRTFHMVTQDDHLEVLKQYVDIEKALPPVIGGKGKPMPGFSEKINQNGGRIDETSFNFAIDVDVDAAEAAVTATTE